MRSSSVKVENADTNSHLKNPEDFQIGKLDAEAPTAKNWTLKCWKDLLPINGMILAIIYAYFFTIATTFLTFLRFVNVEQMSLMWFMGVVFFTCPVDVRSGEDSFIKTSDLKYVFIYGSFTFLSIYSGFVAFQYLPASDATVVVFSFPVMVTIFARVFLKERISLVQMVSLILMLVALSFVTKFPLAIVEGKTALDSFRNCKYILGIVSGLVSAITASLGYVIARKLKNMDVYAINFSISMVGEAFSAIALQSFRTTGCGFHGITIFAFMFSVFLGISILQYSVSLETSGPVSLIRGAADIALVFLWQDIFFGEVASWMSVCGAFIAIVAIILNGIEKVKSGYSELEEDLEI